MSNNPYESPTSAGGAIVRRWRVICMVAIGMALLSFAVLALLGVFRPFGFLEDGPTTPERRMVAAVALGCHLLMYLSLFTSIAAGFRWALSRDR